MAAERKATATWRGSVTEGAGSFSMMSSGTLTDAPVTWAARTEAPDGKTSPEELIAAAHAACYCMALSAFLGRTATAPEQLDVECTVTFAPKPEGGWKVSSSALRVTGRVPGMDQAAFEEAARAGEQGCPVSNALRGNVDISIEATLQG